MQIKMVVFDMAGTTVADDNAVAIAFCKAFALHGYSVGDDDVKPLMGYKKTRAIEIILEKWGAENDDTVSAIHDDFIDEMIDYYSFSPYVMPAAGAETVMRELRGRGLKIMLNTGFPREVAAAIMDRLQWIEAGLVDDYIASDEVENGRPDPAMINKLMQRAGIDDPEAVAKIGDTEVDVNEGRNAGCGLVVAVTTGAFSRAQLEPYAPDHIINHLAELPSLIYQRG